MGRDNKLIVLGDRVKLETIQENLLLVTLRNAFTARDNEGKPNTYDLVIRRKRKTEYLSGSSVLYGIPLIIIPDLEEIYEKIIGDILIYGKVLAKEQGGITELYMGEKPSSITHSVLKYSIKSDSYGLTNLRKLKENLPANKFRRIKRYL